MKMKKVLFPSSKESTDYGLVEPQYEQLEKKYLCARKLVFICLDHALTAVRPQIAGLFTAAVFDLSQVFVRHDEELKKDISCFVLPKAEASTNE